MFYHSLSILLFLIITVIGSISFAGCGIQSKFAQETSQSDPDASVHIQKVSGLGTKNVVESNWEIASRILRDYHFRNVNYEDVPIAAILANLNGVLERSSDGKNIRFAVSPEVALVPITVYAEDITAFDLYKLITYRSNSMISQKESWLVIMPP